MASPPGFVFVWLVPRLLKLDELHPGIPVSLSTDLHSRDMIATETDVLISYGSGGYPGLHAERLMSEQLTPVCSSELPR